MSRVILLSNRVKLPASDASNSDLKNGSAGGLAVAVYHALQQHNTKDSGMNGGVWLGWNGKVEDATPLLPENHFTHQHLQNVAYVTTAFSPEQYQHFYCGFANNVLWAFLHDRTDVISEQPQDFAIYQQVNALFAKQLQQLAEPDDVIWVHDYHFFAVADYCRQLGMTNRIGFFLHIPFAPKQQWQDCPHADILLKQLAQYDMIGVQTQTDKSHCDEVMRPIMATLKTQLSKIQSPKMQPPKINAYPISVDVATIEQQIFPKIQAWQALSTTEKTVKTPLQIVAVDRVDYSKGIVRRLQAFADFLAAYPDYQGKIQLVQIAIPSRLDLPIYRELYDTVKQQVATINQQFATPDWQPIRYSETLLDHADLMALFFDSQICWVNSLKDGMNLVAKEYIASQNSDNPGVLLLSKYAGASEQMTEAVIIDPYDEQNLIESLLVAVTMPHAERQRRYHALMKNLREQDLLRWQTTFLQDLMDDYS